MTIVVSNEIESNSATIRDHGLKVYEKAKKELLNNKKVTISFVNIEMVISSFLNASIGKLYGDFDYELVDNLVSVVGLDEDDIELLYGTVIPNAKEYYQDKEKISKIEKSVF